MFGIMLSNIPEILLAVTKFGGLAPNRGLKILAEFKFVGEASLAKIKVLINYALCACAHGRPRNVLSTSSKRV